MRKRFITSIPLQGKGQLQEVTYDLDDSCHFTFNIKTRFPIIPVLYNCCLDQDEIELVIIKFIHENTEMNLSLFMDEFNIFVKGKQVKYHITIIEVTGNETKPAHKELFQKLIACFQNDEMLFACITYGQKPTPIVLLMAMVYAYRIMEGVEVGALVYGQRIFGTDKSRLFNVMSLFYINDIVTNISNLKGVTVEQRKQMLSMFLDD